MKLPGKILPLVAPYKTWVIAHLLFSVFMALFAVVSIPALIPFLQILFGEVPPVDSAPENLQSLKDFSDFAYYHLGIWIEENGEAYTLAIVCALLVSIFLLKNVFRYLSLFALAPVRTGVVRDLRSKLAKAWLQHDISYFSKRKKGDLLSRMTTDIHEVEWSVLSALEAMIKEPLLMIGSLAIMWIISPSLTLIVFALIIVMGGLIGLVGSRLKKQSSTVQGLVGSITSGSEELISGHKVIRAFNAQNFVQNGFEKINNQHRKNFLQLLWRKDLASPLSEFLGVTVAGIILWVGGQYVFRGEMNPAAFIAFIYAFYSVITPAKSFSTAYFNIRKGVAAIDRLYETIQFSNSIVEAEKPIRVKEFKNKIQLESVWFKYPETDQWVLNNINLEIKKGSNTALVGSSGAGKSTLADLLLRFHDTNQGKIIFDGVEIRHIALKDLRNLFGMVTQDPFLFHNTIAENIAFGKEGITMHEIENAAKMAYAHDFIIDLPHGYNTIIGDRGLSISGGQRQRITIARAILLNNPILLLDEATSSLDAESERMVQLALDQLMKNRTTITIAHRLSTIKKADQIIVLNQGKIEVSGSHEELAATNKFYQNLLRLQLVD